MALGAKGIHVFDYRAETGCVEATTCADALIKQEADPSPTSARRPGSGDSFMSGVTGAAWIRLRSPQVLRSYGTEIPTYKLRATRKP